ncbi:MAG TPA: 2-amino-4-hydroxy-6-hydroxymethyldihydropteridine diphosphokinase [Clostridiaceae bacterium]|nr:2-amino-4-hydroxy-6-hydroxymethyldihydropteridine diphosphokinase [Clostridiaceae bacterium]
MKAEEAYIALGSNIGNRFENIQNAIKAISMIENTTVIKLSKIYETDPVGYVEQDKFLNMVVKIKTGLDPWALLERLQNIEIMLKRERTIRWGPRTIDLDILTYDDLVLNHPKLTIPHPEMLKRAFVLIPLRDIDPNIKFNGIGIDDYIKNCSDRHTVVLYKAFI